jgi:hypothetical protein
MHLSAYSPLSTTGERHSHLEIGQLLVLAVFARLDWLSAICERRDVL